MHSWDITTLVVLLRNFVHNSSLFQHFTFGPYSSLKFQIFVYLMTALLEYFSIHKSILATFSQHLYEDVSNESLLVASLTLSFSLSKRCVPLISLFVTV